MEKAHAKAPPVVRATVNNITLLSFFYQKLYKGVFPYIFYETKKILR
jgi:hypothetical protein